MYRKTSQNKYYPTQAYQEQKTDAYYCAVLLSAATVARHTDKIYTVSRLLRNENTSTLFF